MESYQFSAKAGDIVRMPCGTVGIVNYWDIVCGGNVKRVRVYPLTNFLHRLFLNLFMRTWFYDQGINNLTPL